MHELTDERLAELRKIAEETRPGGGWTADVYQVNDEDGHQVYGADAYGDGTSPAAEHIAAFDPPTVLALLDELERLRSHAGPAGCMAIARQVLEAAIGDEQR